MVESRCGILCSECNYKEMMGCGGCVHINKPFWGDSCPVKSCCEGKGLGHCGKCGDFPCALLNQFAYDKQQGDDGKRIGQCRAWAQSHGKDETATVAADYGQCQEWAQSHEGEPVRHVYVYILDTLADWELGHVTAELNSGRFFKKNADCLSLKTVSCAPGPIHTMGGMAIQPDCAMDDMVIDETSMLLLPGADTWDDPKHGAIIEKARELLASGAAVGAICGATAALARADLLDQRPHTSNGPGFLEMFAPGYKGQSFYIDQPSVADHNLITASCAGSLLWAKQIIGHLGVFQTDTLESWYEYFRSGEPGHFFALMQTLPPNTLQ